MVLMLKEKIKLKYLFSTLDYRKIKMVKIMEIIDEQFERILLLYYLII